MRKLIKRCLSLACAAALLCSVAATAAAANVTAKPTTQKLYMMKEDGASTKQVVREFPIYNINYNNYMKIRDIGYLLDFQVEYNSQWKAVSIITNQHSDGVQVSTSKAVSQQTATPAWSKLYIDGKEVSGLTMYNIAGNNYIKIRDIASAVGFGCCYSGELKAIVLSPFYGYSKNDVMTEGGRRTVAYADGQGNLSFSRSDFFAAAPSTPSTSTTPASTGNTTYKAGDTLTLKKGADYNVELAVGEKVYINYGELDGSNNTDWIEHYVDQYDQNGKLIAKAPWDSSKNLSAITGLVPGTMTIECLATSDYKTVFATIKVTVTSSSSSSSGNGNSSSGTSDAYMDIREEIVRLTNEVRKENGVAELPTDDALMRAAQAAAEEYVTRLSSWSGHDTKMEAEMLRAAGISYGCGANIAREICSSDQVPQSAIDSWVESSGHYQTMIASRFDNIGVGVAKASNGVWVCVQFFGNLDSTLGTYS